MLLLLLLRLLLLLLLLRLLVAVLWQLSLKVHLSTLTHVGGSALCDGNVKQTTVCVRVQKCSCFIVTIVHHRPRSQPRPALVAVAFAVVALSVAAVACVWHCCRLALLDSVAAETGSGKHSCKDTACV